MKKFHWFFIFLCQMKKEKNNSCHFYLYSHLILIHYIFASSLHSPLLHSQLVLSFYANLESVNPMLYLLISCVSFILISKSFTHKPIQSWEGKLKLSSLWFWAELSSFLVSWFQKSRLAIDLFQPIISKLKKMITLSSRVENVEERGSLSLLDLPDLTLECILERLSPSGLCTMGGVCTSLRERCRDDRLWEKHMKGKWGRLIGAAAYREWQLHVASGSRVRNISHQSKKKCLFESLVGKIWPFSWVRPKLARSDCKVRTNLPVESVMSLYLSLESGKFWFPAQVYNREKGNVGFVLSCYDAQVSYDSRTNTFQARYAPYGRRATEDDIRWDRLRAAPVETPSHKLHVSDCLHDLKLGDHIEIQWRRNKEFPYGWWYGVIGHLELCDGHESRCRCHYSDTVTLEFTQYTPGSRWRQVTINRKDHREEGDEADGFYGGIRKLYNEDEIARWKRLWPTQVLE